MSEIDAKVNMSLDEIIKMEKKEKKKKAGTASGKAAPKRTRGGAKGRGARAKANVVALKKEQQWSRTQNGSIHGSFARKRYNKTSNLVRSRSNLALNQKMNVSRGSFSVRRGHSNRFSLLHSRSRTNLTYVQGGFFTNNKTTLKRTSSLPNLRDPTSVHNRLGYQSPAQIAYRNRVKRAKQLLLQRQSQRSSLQNQFRVPQVSKPALMMQQRPLERRQQILTSQRRFTTGGLRSDQIARAQRRAQYEQKLMRINSAQTSANPNVNFLCTLGSDYAAGLCQGSLNPQNRNGAAMSNLCQLPRGRSPFRQSMQSFNMMGGSPLFGRRRSRSRSRSRSRTRNTPASDSGADVDDRAFSEVMYSLPGNLGVTGRKLNDRFSSQRKESMFY